jgi:hypothetical protein
MLKRLAIAVFCLVCVLQATPVHATVITDQEYWIRLDKSRVLLQQARNDSVRRASLLAQVAALWDHVDAMTVGSASTFTPLDMTWLTDGLLTDPQHVDITDRLITINALLNGQNPSQVPQATLTAWTQALQRVLSDPRYQAPTPTPTTTPSPTPTSAPPPDLSGSVGILSGILQVLLSGIAVILLVGAGFYLVHLFARRQIALPGIETEADDPTTPANADTRAADKVEAGDYRRAVRYLYLSCLLSLDEQHLIQYDKALTNREHLAQLATNPALRQQMQGIVNTFERVWYGFAPVDANLYQQFRQSVEQIKQALP